MEKKQRRKKPVNIKLDTKNVDIEFNRDENGNVTIDVDTPKVDARIEKNEAGTSIDIDVDDKQYYDFVSNGENPSMQRGKIWRVTGELLKILIKKGFGNIKK
jgi:hypothetical protein